MKEKLLVVFAILVLGVLHSSCRTAPRKKVYMHNTFKTVKRTLKEALVANSNDSITIIFPTQLMFPFNSSIISNEVLPVVQSLSKILAKHEQTAVLICGFTDSIGTIEYNNELSAQRASSAKAALINYEIQTERINTWGMGKRNPVASNSTEEGRAKNRRVEFVILYKDLKK